MAANYTFVTERIKKLYDKLQTENNYIDIERAKYFTESFKETEGEPVNIRFAKALLHTAQNITVRIEDGQLLAGQVGGPERYGILYPELDGLFFENLKEVLDDRKEATFRLREEDRKYLKDVVAPYWKGKTYYEDVAASFPEDILKLTYNPQNIKESRYLINETATMNSATQWVHDYKIGIDNGFEAIKNHAISRLSELEKETIETVPDIDIRKAYLKSSVIVSDAIITFAERYSDEAARLADIEKDKDRRKELLEMSRILRKVPRYPAETFYEALQSQFIIQMFSRLEQKTAGTISNGRMDQYLYPYFKRDKEKGELTDERAKELISCLWLAIAKFRDVYVSPAGGAFSNGYAHWEAVTIGGLTPDGLDATNELSYLILENKRELPLDYPDLAARIHTNTPERFLNEIAETIKLGTGHPKLLNDEEIIPIYLSKGATFAEANDYAVSGCTETRLVDRETWTSKGPAVNLAALIELTLRNGRVKKYGDELLTIETGSIDEFTTWDEFYDAFKKQEEYFIKKTCQQIICVHKAREGHFASPLGSVLHGLCIQKERDIHSQQIDGGIDLAFFDMVGFATVIDSLAAIKKNVFEDKNTDLREIVKAIDSNFEGYEILRQRLIHSAAYGNNDTYADQIGKDIDRIAGEVSAREAKKYSDNLIIDIRYVPVSANVAMGRVISALPDGRLEGMPISDGTSAAQGADINDPTSVLLSNFKSKNLDLNYKIKKRNKTEGRIMAAVLVKRAGGAVLKSGIATWGIFLVVWWILSLFQSEVLLPGPLETLKGAKEIVLNGKLLQFALISLRRVFIGWTIGLAAGIPLGLMIGRITAIRKLFEPFINFFRFVPGLALITLFIMWFGVGELSKIVLIAYGTIFTVVVNIVAGIVSMDKDRINSARVLGVSEFQILFTVIWPSVIPYVFTGARLGLGGAFASIVAAEMLSAKEGIGYLIFTARMYFHTDWIITGVIVLGLLGYLSDKLLRVLGARFLGRYGVREKKAF